MHNYYTTIQRILHPESNSTYRRQRALRVLLHTEGKRTFISERNSTHRRQGDLLEIHPCVLQDIPGIPATRPSKDIPVFPDIPVIPDTPETFRTFQSFMTFQPFQAILQCSSISRESTPFQHSPIRMHILHILQFLQFNWFPQKTPPSTSWAITNYKHYILQKKGDVAISVEQDTILQNRIISPLRLVIKSY